WSSDVCSSDLRERISDMNKKWMVVIISVLLLAVVIGVGGKVYMDKRAEQKEAEKIEAERMSVEALKNTFENIESVEFKKRGYDRKTGIYRMTVKITSEKEKLLEFYYEFSINHPNKISAWEVIYERNVQIEGKTKQKFKVTYTDGSKKFI